MARISVEFTYHVDIIEVPDSIAKNIRKYQRAFDKWLYDKNNDHGLWVIIDGQKMAVAFDCQDFVDFLNKFVIKDGDPACVLVETDLPKSPQIKPDLFF